MGRLRSCLGDHVIRHLSFCLATKPCWVKARHEMIAAAYHTGRFTGRHQHNHFGIRKCSIQDLETLSVNL